MRQILAAAGIPVRRQVDSGGETWTGRVDFRHESLPIVIEVQSEAFHLALTDVEHDERRHAQLLEDGFVYREVWDTDVFATPWTVVATIESAIAEVREVLCCRKGQ